MFLLDFVVGIIRLTVEGTRSYQRLDKIGRKDFINEMGIEVSKCIPIVESRLIHSGHFLEYDRINRSDILFITYRIDSPDENDFNKKSAKDVFDDFAKLLEINGDVKTCVDVNNYMQYIDKRFGFRETCRCNCIYIRKIFWMVNIYFLNS